MLVYFTHLEVQLLFRGFCALESKKLIFHRFAARDNQNTVYISSQLQVWEYNYSNVDSIFVCM